MAASASPNLVVRVRQESVDAAILQAIHFTSGISECANEARERNLCAWIFIGGDLGLNESTKVLRQAVTERACSARTGAEP
jgi:hypothetical protein